MRHRRRSARAFLAVMVFLLGAGQPVAPAAATVDDTPLSVRLCAGKIDLATASVEALTSLPGLERGTAKRVVQSRESLPLASAFDLVTRSTISTTTLLELLSADPCLSSGSNPRADFHDLVACGPGTAVDLNTARAEDVQRALPGVTDVAALVGSRPLEVKLGSAAAHSNAALRALAVAFTSGRVCLSDGPFTLPDGSRIVWVNPGDPFLLERQDRTLAGDAGAVSDSCWARINDLDPATSLLVPEALRGDLNGGTRAERAERVGDYHIDCGVETEVQVSFVETGMVGATPNYVFALHEVASGGLEGLYGTNVDTQTGRVTFLTDELSPIGRLADRVSGDSLTRAEAELCFGNPLNSNPARCYWVQRDIVPWVDSEVDDAFGDGATFEDGTRANAFKHCILSAVVTDWYGAEFAKALLDAHESGQSGVASQMDLLNNAVGRTYGTREDFTEDCLTAAKLGGLWYLSADGHVVSTAPAGGGGGSTFSYIVKVQDDPLAFVVTDGVNQGEFASGGDYICAARVLQVLFVKDRSAASVYGSSAAKLTCPGDVGGTARDIGSFDNVLLRMADGTTYFKNSATMVGIEHVLDGGCFEQLASTHFGFDYVTYEEVQAALKDGWSIDDASAACVG